MCEVRALMLSMHDNEQYCVEALKAGAVGYVLKTAANRELVLSKKTVERYRANVLGKLGMRSRVDPTRYAIRRGLVEP